MKSIGIACPSAFALFGMLTGTSASWSQEPGQSIVRTEAVVFPAYEAYQHIEYFAPTLADYQEAISDNRFVMEKLTYRSDGLEVHAYLYRPAKRPANGKQLPVVIFNRGSYTRDEFVPEVLMPGRRLAQEGYLVIAPMLRGSGGAPGHDEMGGADLNDVLNIVAALREIDYADVGRLFLYGESRGGIMSLLAARSGFPARAVATWGAITDLGEYIREGGPYRELGPQIWAGFPANEAEITESRSALYWAGEIKLPVLIMNGSEDNSVSPVHAMKLA